ncbi:hypothetical protein Celaphus_00014002 [Cervus elaphus hippelaphus]|uniref:Uncharacterized protein n=1 Tax=Cervus elaphus hippelaphus TaxID=46360 RepID=A0A212CDD6_CEREH|nr:hypothetical protein Celaphus_00014002 [Cervus elaphus hippelaphus]
MNGVQFLSTPM